MLKDDIEKKIKKKDKKKRKFDHSGLTRWTSNLGLTRRN